MYGYKLLTFNLATARTNFEVCYDGDLLLVKDIYDTATLQSDLAAYVSLRITDPSADVLRFKKGDKIKVKAGMQLNKFYLTNTAQAGKSVDFVICGSQEDLDIFLQNLAMEISTISGITNPVEVIQNTAADLLAQVSQPTAANLNATVVQASPANLRTLAKRQSEDSGDYGAVSVAAAATQIVAVNGNRTTISVLNNDATNTLYVGWSNAVTTANGFKLLPGESLSLEGGIAVWGIANAGTCDVRYIASRYS